MIVLFTDFGWRGPYVGQLHAVLHLKAPGVPVVELFNDAPVYNPRAAAHLLAAYVGEFPPGTVFLGVVDPGVGGARRPVFLEADGRWYAGPDNGLFNVVAARARETRWWEVTWRPAKLSSSFHGRDLFAPIAAMLSLGRQPEAVVLSAEQVGYAGWEGDLAEVIYVDHYGNAMTGLRAAGLEERDSLEVGGRLLLRKKTFSEAGRGEAFWYENANGLAEIAVNQGNAAECLQLTLGTPVGIRRSSGNSS